MCFFIYLTLPVRLLITVAAAVVNSTCQGAAAAGARQLLHAFLLFTWEPAKSLSLTLALCFSCCYTARCSGYSAVNAPTRLTLPTVNSSAQTVLSDCLLRGWESAAYRRSVCVCVCATVEHLQHTLLKFPTAVRLRPQYAADVSSGCCVYIKIAPVFRVKFRVVFIRIAKTHFFVVNKLYC